VHLVGSPLRPAVVTADADLDALLGVAALALAGMAAGGARWRPVARGAAALTLGLSAFVALAMTAGVQEPAAATDPRSLPPEFAGAITAAGRGPGSMPAWSLAEARGLAAERGGRPVVVNFWASWCAPCHAEAAAVARSAQAMADEVAFVGVLIDDDPASGAAFAERYGLPFPTVADGGLRRELGVPGLPTTVVLRPDGSVAARLVGGLDARGLAAAVDRART
jgi:thiol-disulfide isomerase/thioredoxin